MVYRTGGIALFVGAVLLGALPGGALAEEAVQTDWSGGDGTPGPVSAWGNEFYTSSDVSWFAGPGRLALSSSALASPVGHLINGSYEGTIGVGVGDIDLDGDLDVVGTAQTSAILNWWENDGGDPPAWTEHIIGTPAGAAGVDVAWEGGRFDWWEAAEFDSIGELESSIHDSGIGARMGSIDWTGTEPPGTSLRFQVRSSNDPGDLGTWSGDITSPADFPDVLDRYSQYRVLLETTDPEYSPLLYDVTFGPALAGLAADVGVLESAGLKAEPNPFGREVTLSFALPVAGRVRVEVFDVSGRMVRGLADTYLAAGPHRFGWDGTDDRGGRAAPGLYWLCLDAEGQREARGVVLLR